MDDDVMSFTRWALTQGWGDGLPLVPPTEMRVREFLRACGRFPDELVALVPPLGGECTVEKIAVNAVMAGAPPDSMALLCAALEAMVDPAFNLGALNATTGSVVPALIVNGPQRDALGIPYEVSCVGGVASAAPAIGRALRLVVRNVGGQAAGITSQSVFGTPGRVAGIVFGEWEERSPWAPLAQRRGVPGDAVTAYGAMGTTNLCDVIADNGRALLEYVGKGLARPGDNGTLPSSAFSQTFVAFNPVWAPMIAREVPDVADVQEILWQHASIHVDDFPAGYAGPLRDMSRTHGDRVHVAQSPDDVLVAVCGGMGNLHALVLPSWGDTRATTCAVRTAAAVS
ncbi:MAG TPA: hypothetical protein VHC41_07660 [Mycobacteriales bacterium]|nr:hypothetical protein [Mycobacteriales bacterium]